MKRRMLCLLLAMLLTVGLLPAPAGAARIETDETIELPAGEETAADAAETLEIPDTPPTAINVEYIGDQKTPKGDLIGKTGDSFPFRAVDQNGNETPVTWKNGSTWAGSLDENGVFTAGSLSSGGSSMLYITATSTLDETVKQEGRFSLCGYQMSQYNKTPTVALSEDGQTAKTISTSGGYDGSTVWTYEGAEGIAQLSAGQDLSGKKSSIKFDALRPGTFRWKVILPVLIGAVLVFAYWYGGSGPGLQGWTVERPSPSAALTPSPSVSASTPASPAPPPTRPSSPPSPSSPPPSPSLPPSPSPTPSPSPAPTPVPEDRPTPAEPQDAEISDAAHTCTLSVSCATILDNMDWLDPEKTELVPEDGWILEPTEVAFYEGESVFDVLQRTCQQNKIHMEFSNTPMYDSTYIEGIHNLYEFDCGEQSGWMYQVNGRFPNYGCSRYALQEGDVVEWKYTCDLGVDVGGYNATGE